MNHKIILFDVDGTLAVSTRQIEPKLVSRLRQLYHNGYQLGIVGGGNYQKIIEQIGDNTDFLSCFTYIFAENGITAYQFNQTTKQMELLAQNNIKDCWAEPFITRVVKSLLQLVIESDLPFLRGNFIAFRQGMIYFTPVGSDCSWDERMQFVRYDQKHNVRKQMINQLLTIFQSDNLDAKLGGMIGIGIHPKGWDKTYVLQFLQSYSEIYYFGDQYQPDGNDYPLLTSSNVSGYRVNNPDDTYQQLELFL